MKEFQVADLPIVALTLLTLASSTPVTSPATTVVTQPTNLTRFILNSNYSATSTSNCRLFIKLCHWVPKGSIFSQNRSKSMVSKLQVPFLFGFYLKIRERKKLERKKVRAWPLCHPRQPTHEPFRFIGHINASVP